MFKSRTERRKKKMIKKTYKKAEELSGSQLAIAFRRFRKNKAGLIGLLLTIGIFALAVFADYIAPYDPLVPMALEYHYTPWFQPPGVKEGAIYATYINRIQDFGFETGFPVWTYSPGWQRINLTEEGIFDSLSGTWGALCTSPDAVLTQDVSDSEKLYFKEFEFRIYLAGSTHTTLSVIFEFEDHDPITLEYEISVSDTWVLFHEKDIEIIQPETISFSKSSGSDIVIDQIKLVGGEYFQNFHLMGTNRDSQDVFSKLVYGTRVSLIVSVGAIIISFLIGLPLGLLAGYFRGKIDEVIMRITDMFLTLPFYFVMILVIVLIMQTQWLDNLIIALGISAEVILVSVTLGLGLFGWMNITRLIRATILQVREMDYVEAARCLGASNKRIMIIHILPNILAPLIVATTFNLAVNIVAEAGLAYLGYTNDSLASWGRELNNGFGIVTQAWWPVIFPALLIISAVMAFNLLGDGLRDAFDPRLR